MKLIAPSLLILTVVSTWASGGLCIEAVDAREGEIQISITPGNAEAFHLLEATDVLGSEASWESAALAAPGIPVTEPAFTVPITQAREFYRILEAPPETRSVVIYGGTLGGIGAALAAARDGVENVLILEPSGHIGGLTASGLSHTDFRTFESLGGIWREFMVRVFSYYEQTYGADSPQHRASQRGGFYEPRVAEALFHEMLADAGVEIRVDQRLMATFVQESSGEEARRLRSVLVLDESSGTWEAWKAPVFVDATYEGDLMAMAGVPYVVGSESRDTYNETAAPEVANHYVQCYNHRITLTKDPDNRLPLPRPEGYDREDFRPLIDSILNNRVSRLDDIVRGPVRPVPNEKADFNDKHGAPNSLRICATENWPDGSPEDRQAIDEAAGYRALGLFWTILHDDEIGGTALGQSIRAELAPWGLPQDEFVDNGHYPHAIYVREARRMVGQYIFTEHDIKKTSDSLRTPHQPDAVAICDYGANSHGTHYGPNGDLRGLINSSVRTWEHRPYSVPYGVMLPVETEGLLVPVAISSSHVGFNALRYEPAWTALGEAAGTAAALAIEEGVEVSEVPIDELQKRLHQKGAITFYVSDIYPDSPLFRPVQFFGNRGMFQDLYPANASGGPGGGIGGFNQWRFAYRNHDLDWFDPITPDLAQNWLEYLTEATIPHDESRLPPADGGGLRRGEFLLQMFEAVEAPGSD